MLDYKHYRALSESEREGMKLPPPFLTVRWWDPLAVAELRTQSWFGRLREDLNKGGKVKLTLGVWQYEQEGTRESTPDRRLPPELNKLFEEAAIVTVTDTRKLLECCMRERVFTKTLVLLDGELVLPLSLERLCRLGLREAASACGCELTLKPDALDRAIAPEILNELFELAMKIGKSFNLVNEWRSSPENLTQIRVDGERHVLAHLMGLDERGNPTLEFRIAFPPEAVTRFAEPSNFGARVLGWLEHGAGGDFFVRAIAFATVDLINVGAEGSVSIDA